MFYEMKVILSSASIKDKITHIKRLRYIQTFSRPSEALTVCMQLYGPLSQTHLRHSLISFHRHPLLFMVFDLVIEDQVS